MRHPLRSVTRAKLAALLARLDERFPFRGPCGICGGPDARHRLWDAINGNARSGVVAAASWYSMPPSDVRLIQAAYREARRLHRLLPGRYSRTVEDARNEA